MNIKFTIVIVNISILSPSPTEYYNNNLVDDNVEFYCAEYYGVKVFAGWVYIVMAITKSSWACQYN